MNRRTFLQSVGATAVLVVSVPVLAKKEKPYWIKMTDEKPKIGQDVLIFSYSEYSRKYGDCKNVSLSFSKVDNCIKYPALCTSNTIPPDLLSRDLFVYDIYFLDGKILKKLKYDSSVTKAQLEKILNVEWIDHKNLTVEKSFFPLSWWYDEKRTWKYLYWIPLTKDVKNRIPEFPIGDIKS